MTAVGTIERLVYGAVTGIMSELPNHPDRVSLRLGGGAWNAVHADPEARKRMRLVGDYPRRVEMETTTAVITLEKDPSLGPSEMALTVVV